MRKVLCFAIAMILIAGCFVSPVSAADLKTGFYNIGTADGVTITAVASSGSVTEVNEDVDGDGTADKLFNGSDKLTVAYSKATPEKEYIVWLVKGTSLPSSDEAANVYYVNQINAADSSSIEFIVYPKEITETMAMTVFITSNDGKDAISVPVNYLAGAAASFLKGDVNGDGSVDAKDLTTLAKHVAKITYITDSNLLKAADVTGEGDVDAKDLTKLARYVAKIINTLD